MCNCNYNCGKIKKVCAYITYFLHEEIKRCVKIKDGLEKAKIKLTDETESQKAILDEYRAKTENPRDFCRGSFKA